ncbi:MAG: hypothetical protein N3C60_03645 [Calditerrivibrio sp.]|nr:hypothetical protein [Calditerrivibrio sp.]
MIKYKGWVINYDDFEPPYKIKDFFYILKNLLLELILIIPFIISLTILLLYNVFNVRKRKKKKFLLGTTPVVTLKLLKQIFEDEFDLDFFCYKDEYSIIKNIDIITIDKVVPIVSKYPYTIGKYFAFFWAICRYDVFILYFDGGFLERSVFVWRLEPFIYKVFKKKIVMFPYGADVWSVYGDGNMLRQYANAMSRKRYFLLDEKRRKRVVLWCRYADLVISFIDYIRFVPRADIITYGGQILKLDDYNYCFDDINGAVNIVHAANDEFRKGTYFINHTMKILEDKFDMIKYSCYVGLDRDNFVEVLKKSHIFIEQITYGFLSFSAVEAMLMGKVVILYLDDSLNDFYRYIDYEYYNEFFEKLPVVVVNRVNFIEKITSLIKNIDLVKELSIKSRKFSIDYVSDNIDVWRMILHSLNSNVKISQLILEQRKYDEI